MWVLFHRNAKTRTIRGGETFIETCPSCHSRAQFHEVELSESFGVFFVDIVGDKEHAFRCGACGEVFDRKDRPTPMPVATKSAAEAEREKLIAAQRRRDLEREELNAAQRRRDAIDAQARIEDELAELKRRMGRT